MGPEPQLPPRLPPQVANLRCTGGSVLVVVADGGSLLQRASPLRRCANTTARHRRHTSGSSPRSRTPWTLAGLFVLSLAASLGATTWFSPKSAVGTARH